MIFHHIRKSHYLENKKTRNKLLYNNDERKIFMILKESAENYPKREGMHKAIVYENSSDTVKARTPVSKRNSRKAALPKTPKGRNLIKSLNYKHDKKLRTKRRKKGRMFKKLIKDKLLEEIEEIEVLNESDE